jgi:hypothetical protein
VIGECDSGVPNFVLPSGCTILDEIAKAAAVAENHDQFVSNVANLTNGLRKTGVITGRESGTINSCAARSQFP